ncbi:MAG TPA: Gfo/Idh/MocA family oxidoreductase [Phycisphaerae bacterium]|nr:Gfo/Idh/MocA family oxidoreductase [Phycisphaerae bacterium]
MADCLRTAVVGVGNWGRNLLRNFAHARRCTVSWICDVDEKTLAKQAATVPNARATIDFDQVLGGDVDAVVIATKATTHYELAARALTAGKHVYVEKPLCLSTRDAEALVALAEKNSRKLMVGHLLLYHTCVEKLREMIVRGELGGVYYMYTQRVNLGVVRQDENAWWSLAPHDVSVICHLFDAQPVAVSAFGQCYLQKGVEDVVFAMLRFADGKIAHIHVSWLDPHKIRKMTVVGTQRMVTFDDMDASEKIRIYDKGADVKEGYENYARSIAIRSGDILIPRVPANEPLQIEAQHFVDCVLDDKPIRTDGADGVRVVRVLEAGGESIRLGGKPVEIQKGAT